MNQTEPWNTYKTWFDHWKRGLPWNKGNLTIQQVWTSNNAGFCSKMPINKLDLSNKPWRYPKRCRHYFFVLLGAISKLMGVYDGFIVLPISNLNLVPQVIIIVSIFCCKPYIYIYIHVPSWSLLKTWWKSITSCTIHVPSLLITSIENLVGRLEHEFYFYIYWECHNSNWLSYFSEGWLNHQPEIYRHC